MAELFERLESSDWAEATGQIHGDAVKERAEKPNIFKHWT